jgi:superfamily II DNA/RNA helicase
VSTDVTSRGIDIPNVGVVIHVQSPKDIDSFLHRCGRTARIGNQGKSIIIADADDNRRMLKYSSDLGNDRIKVIEVPLAKLDAIRDLVKSANELEKAKFRAEKESK